MVSARFGTTLVPYSARDLHIEGVCYVDITDDVTAPVVMSVRRGESSAELALLRTFVESCVVDR
jgi:hypothetical protein